MPSYSISIAGLPQSNLRMLKPIFYSGLMNENEFMPFG